ncbi:MAG TPA: MBL fold metallo-hydrolase [Candidatus Avipropionibacterium avicola]|uniref:MBL fold metallo-hydrolase n=1 Tax=Candidatus Avipropionibacterium avicola TaxID=2840701 RepID=A0A9D1GXN4_9ACTN|nr:MBL fold metallo-hydrolase [Candidatus Avipropionibacterium avicola]
MSDHQSSPVDPYHVTPGGEPVVIHRDGRLTVSKLSVGGMDNNVYLLQDGDNLVLIDAAADPDRLLEVTQGYGPDVVVTTHRHHDHIGALAELAEQRGPRLFAGAPDVEAITEATGAGPITGVWDGDHITCGPIMLRVVGLVGHTPGAIALALKDELLFTGDSLFPGGPGKTNSPEDFTSLMDDLESKLFARYGDHTAVHPGHGDSTTIGHERPQLQQWRERGW